jgi:Hemerythrin HHE cation binding domain
MTAISAQQSTRIAAAVLFTLLVGPSMVAAGQEPPVTKDYPMPLTLLEEHAEIYTSLEQAVRQPGPLGRAARDVADVMKPHTAKEERYGLAALRLLRPLARGELRPEMPDWLPACDALRTELDTLVREHRAIARAVDQLARTPWAEGQPEYAFLAHRILRHAPTEEEILYPAALLVGEYVRLKWAQSADPMIASVRVDHRGQ